MSRGDHNPGLQKLLEEIRNHPEGKCRECGAVVPGRVWYNTHFFQLCQPCRTKHMGKRYTCTTCGLYPCDGLNDLVHDYIRVICHKCYDQLPEFNAWYKIEYSQAMRGEGYLQYHENYIWVRARNKKEARAVIRHPGAYQSSLEEPEWKVVSITKLRQERPGETLEAIEKDWAVLV